MKPHTADHRLCRFRTPSGPAVSPTFPKTFAGAKTTTDGQIQYWSAATV